VERTLDAPLRTAPGCKLGSVQGLRYEADGDWLAMIFALMRSLSSDDPVDVERGSLAAYELSVWLPVAKLVEGPDGNGLAREPAWHLPFVLTAPVASVMTGREVYGYPKWPAFIDLPEEVGARRYRASYRRGFAPEVGASAVGGGRRLRPLEDGAVELDQGDAPRLGPAGARPRSAGGAGDGGTGAGDADAVVGAFLRRMVDNAPLVFLKQFPGIDGPEGPPCYQAIVEARVPITGAQGFRRPAVHPPLRLDLPEGVADDLGMVEAQTPVAHLELERVSFEVQRGDERWVAAARPGEPCRPVRRRLEPAPVPDDVVADVRFFVVPADAARLAALVRTDLRRPLAFPPATPIDGTAPPQVHGGPGWVGLAFVHRHPRAGGAEERTVRGWELVVCVPVWAEAAGGAEPAWYVPLAVASPGASVLYAREALGLPYQEGFLVVPEQPTGAHTAALSTPIATSPPGSGRMTVEWRKEVVLEVDAGAGGPTAAGTGPDDAALPPVGADDVAPWLDLAGPVVFSLKQFRHVAATDRACYQSLVRCALDVGSPIGSWSPLTPDAVVVTRAYPDLICSIGIVAAAQPVSAGFRATGVPFRFRALDEPWVART
jgi:hypothetical protein